MTLGRPMAFITLASLLFAFFLSGCGPGWPTRTRVAAPPGPFPEIRPPKTLIDPDSVEERIQTLETILAREEALDADRREEAKALLEDYRIILKELRTPGAPSRGVGATAILFERLGALEARYFETEQIGTGPPAPIMLLPAPKERRLRDTYLSGDYEGVIQTCLDLESTYGPEALTPQTELIFAMALAESGKIREAIRTGERVIPELVGRPDLIHLRSRMVDWYLRQGNSRQAREHYEKLVDEIQERRSILELVEMALEPSVTHAPPDQSPDALLEETVDEDSGPLADLLHRVDTLMQAQEFDQARMLLVRQRIRYPEGTQTAAIDRAMDRVDRAEAALDRRTPAVPVQPRVSEALDEARDLMEAEDYENALARLEGLRGSPDETDPQVEALRLRAESELVRSGREEAAKLFLMARNAQSSKEKETHLRASHRLLSELLERFPESSLAPRIRNNLNTVEEEMKRIGLPRENRGRRD